MLLEILGIVQKIARLTSPCAFAEYYGPLAKALAGNTPPSDAGMYIYHLAHNDELFQDEFCTWKVAKQEAVLRQFSSTIRRIQASRLVSKCKRVPLGRMGISKKCKNEVNQAMADAVNEVLMSSCSAAPQNFSRFVQTAHKSARMDGSYLDRSPPFDDGLDFIPILSALRRSLRPCIKVSSA